MAGFMDWDEDEIGAERPPLSPVEKQDLYQAILDKHDPQVAEAREAARGQQRMAGIGSALEGMARAKGVARGGKGVDQSFYDNLGKQKDGGIDSAISDKSQAVKKYLMDKRAKADAEQMEYDRGRDSANDQYRQDKLDSTEENRLAANKRSDYWANRRLEQSSDQFAKSDKRQNESAALRAKEGREGKTMTAGATTEIGKLDSADALIEDLRKDYEENASGYGSGLKSMAPWSTDAANYDQTRRQKAQILGGIMEGGKLTDPDFDRYYKMMPSPWDTDEQAANKLNELKQTLKMKREGMVDTLGGAGFNTSGVQPKKPEALPGRNDTAPKTFKMYQGVKYEVMPNGDMI